MQVNIDQPTWDQELDRERYRWKRAYVGRQAGCAQLGASLYEVPPGAEAFPLHAHMANEELMIVLTGRPTLRTVDGERGRAPGAGGGCAGGGGGA
ncbi:MAG: cupin domain-containing protein, partial [Thermoleophilia bacterium]